MKNALRIALAVAFIVLTAHSPAEVMHVRYHPPIWEMSPRAYFLTYVVEPDQPKQPTPLDQFICRFQPMLCNCPPAGCGY